MALPLFIVPAKADPGLSLEEMKAFVRKHFDDFVNGKKSEVALAISAETSSITMSPAVLPSARRRPKQ